MRVCSVCGIEKPLENFHICLGYRRHDCKLCNNAALRKHRGRPPRIKIDHKATERVCKICGILKPITEFSPTTPRKGEPRWRCDCKSCNAIRASRIRKLKPEKQRKAVRDYRIRERERKYGLSQEGFEKLLFEQDGACAICKSKFVHSPHVDHCHVSGKLRALLCTTCNCGLGHFKDSPDLLQSAIEYLKRFLP